MRRFAIALLALLALAPAAGAHEPGYTLRGYGTPTVDGVIAAGEWEAAGKLDFAANRLPEDGGGSTPATLFVMNDAENLYAAVRVHGARVESSSIALEFDNDHDGVPLENGDDVLVVNPSVRPMLFDDFRTNQPPCTGGVCGFLDSEAGGTSDGTAAATTSGGFAMYELSHPLNSADDAHDFSLVVGNRIGFLFSLRFCSTSCVDTDVPAIGRQPGDIVITSLNRTPPDTEIRSGPSDGSFTNTPAARFEFTGRDDVIRTEDLVFECSLDGGSFQACSSPTEIVPQAEGAHSLAVRAVDEAENADATPTSRRWTLDTTPPSRPTVRGPRRTKGLFATYRLAATDALTSPAELRFRCAINSRRFRACGRPLRARLRPGPNVIRVVALDRAANESRQQLVRVRRVKR